MLNKSIIIGVVGNKGIELRYTPGNGKAVANFSLGCKRNFKTNDKYEWDNIPTVAWGQQAEYIANNADVGDLVCASGRLQVRVWESDNGKRYVTELIADEVSVLKRKDAATSAGQSMGAEIDFVDDDRPF